MRFYQFTVKISSSIAKNLGYRTRNAVSVALRLLDAEFYITRRVQFVKWYRILSPYLHQLSILHVDGDLDGRRQSLRQQQNSRQFILSVIMVSCNIMHSVKIITAQQAIT